MRGIKRPSEESRDEAKPSKEPMLNTDHLMMSSSHPASAGGVGGGVGVGGVLHQLLGPPHASSQSGLAPSGLRIEHPVSVGSTAAAVAAASSAVAAAAATAAAAAATAISASPSGLQSSNSVGGVGSGSGPGSGQNPNSNPNQNQNQSQGSSAGPVSCGVVGGLPGLPASSKLCEKNKMLASLLAKTPVMPSPLSTSIASPKPSALPQEKLPKDLKVSQPSQPSQLSQLEKSRCALCSLPWPSAEFWSAEVKESNSLFKVWSIPCFFFARRPVGPLAPVAASSSSIRESLRGLAPLFHPFFIQFSLFLFSKVSFLFPFHSSFLWFVFLGSCYLLFPPPSSSLVLPCLFHLHLSC